MAAASTSGLDHQAAPCYNPLTQAGIPIKNNRNSAQDRSGAESLDPQTGGPSREDPDLNPSDGTRVLTSNCTRDHSIYRLGPGSISVPTPGRSAAVTPRRRSHRTLVPL
jgi:hypothetical protein